VVGRTESSPFGCSTPGVAFCFSVRLIISIEKVEREESLAPVDLARREHDFFSIDSFVFLGLY